MRQVPWFTPYWLWLCYWCSFWYCHACHLISFIALFWNEIQQSLILNWWCDCLQLVLMMHRFQRNANLQVAQKVMMMRMTTLQTMKCHRTRLHLTTMCVIQKMKTTVKIQTVCVAHVWFIYTLCCVMFGVELFGCLILWKFDDQSRLIICLVS